MIIVSGLDAGRTSEIWDRLRHVTDPELDESVTSLEFITSVRIEEENEVWIEFRLPTYWCAPNFAFLMASDMRDAVTEIPWVRNVKVELLDHFSSELINRGVALRQDFRDAFTKVDAILTPTSPVPPFKLGERTNDPLQMYLADIYTVTGSLAGVPGISVPCGRIDGKLPVGLQIFGAAFAETRVLQLAHAFEQAAGATV